MKKIVLTISILVFGFASAQNVFQESLATFTVGTQLSGQGVWSNNSSNPGGLGSCTGAGCFNAKILATGLDYLNYGVSPNSLEIRPDLDAVGRGFTAVSSGDLYVGMVLNLTSSLTGATDFFRVMSGGNFNTTFRMSAKNNGGSFFLGFSKGASGTTVFTTNSYSYNENHLVIFKYAIRPGTTDDLVSIYVDPMFTAGVPAVADAQTSAGTDQTAAIDRLSIRQNALTGTAGRMGLLSVSRSWAGLVFPPLATNSFIRSNLDIVTSNAKDGILLINSRSVFENTTLTIYDMLGRIIDSKKQTLSENRNEVAIQPIQVSGIYSIEISDNGQKMTQKFSVN